MEAVTGEVVNLREMPQTPSGALGTDAAMARRRMEEYIDRGRKRGMQVIERMEREIPRDMPVFPNTVQFQVEANSLQVRDEKTDGWVHMHSNAVQQAAERVKLPTRYIQRLMEPDAASFGKELVAHNLKELYSKLNFGDEPFMRARTVGTGEKREVRAFMSANYKPLDSRPLFMKFLEACDKAGAVVVDGYASDTRLAMSAILPVVQQVTASEFLVYGIRLRNSDFGRGPVDMEPFLTRLLCLNGMTTESAYKKIHLGGRTSWEISQETYQKELDAVVSAIGDVVTRRLDDGFISAMTRQFAESAQTEISKEKAELIISKALKAEERKRVIEMFESETRDPFLMPQGRNAWSLANAVSFLANQEQDPDRRMELQDTAGAILGAKKTATKAVTPTLASGLD